MSKEELLNQITNAFSEYMNENHLGPYDGSAGTECAELLAKIHSLVTLAEI